MIVRALVDDHPEQAEAARAILSRPFMVGATVLLETEWVLRSQYHWSRAAISSALTEIVDLPHLIESPPRIRWAIVQFAAGADFADMVHVASAEGASAFATFDKRLKRKAGTNTPLPIETLT